MATGSGVRDVTKPGAVDEHTMFQLASVTTRLTGAAAASVVDAGTREGDTPLFTYVPEFVGDEPYRTRGLTARDWLAMRTGWPAYPGDRRDRFGYDRAASVRRRRSCNPRYRLRAVAP
jgi:CubicO group peptidase (beta-lactamase class C family)